MSYVLFFGYYKQPKTSCNPIIIIMRKRTTKKLSKEPASQSVSKPKKNPRCI